MGTETLLSLPQPSRDAQNLSISQFVEATCTTKLTRVLHDLTKAIHGQGARGEYMGTLRLLAASKRALNLLVLLLQARLALLRHGVLVAV